MKVINLGNSLFSNYLLEFEKGAVLVDAGNACSYGEFLKKLSRADIDLKKIKFVVLTHVHSDHISYLNDLLKNNNEITLIAGRGAAEKLLEGCDEISAFTSKTARALSRMTTALKITPRKWEPIDITQFKTVIIGGEDKEILKEYGLSVFPLPGHTDDGIGLIDEDGQAFCGDQIMSAFPSKHSLPLLIKNPTDYLESYDRLIALAPRVIYLGHGAPKDLGYLLKNRKYAQTLTLYAN